MTADPEHEALAADERNRLVGEIAELKAALRRHTFSFEAGGGVHLCGGCLSRVPCPDLKLTEGSS